MKDENKNSETLALFLIFTAIAFVIINGSKYLYSLYEKNKANKTQKTNKNRKSSKSKK